MKVESVKIQRLSFFLHKLHRPLLSSMVQASYLKRIKRWANMRDTINEALKQAMRDKAKERLSTLRLINAAIKDMDISLRGEGREEGASDDDILKILAKMVKQRQESARTYEEGGRLDLAEREFEEIKVIEEFLPRQLEETEVVSAIDTAISAVGASSIRDMGKIMGALKSKYTGQIDFAKAGPMVKERLNQL